MSEHYFSQTPSVRHDRRRMEVRLRGRSFEFVTDSGVFSKEGIDFGSRLLIETMVIPEDAAILDVGCGYGPIGITAAYLAAKGKATLIDINERAVQLAQENAALNGIHNVEAMQSDLFDKVRSEKFTHILTNPPIRAGKGIVHAIFEQASEHLLPQGELWVVIQKKQGAPSAFKKLESIFPSVEEVSKDKGYRIFRATRTF
ncbi:class I SAM-dependent methyltransferase [Ferviditalea candida]|uniref:Class I SAM-dependent methyltransferase n=1 Tax=Ferviditalea candida TaxID=3108399 RepID=A0ABU5ZMZ6_9BACL|nr:class I SAM-dependent methyltransferase [Paenibacillaceae bacterium T2]